jgi:hypothetical protein
LAFVEFPVERGDNLPDLVHDGSWNWHHELVGLRKSEVYSMDDVSDTTPVIIKHPTAVR